MEKKEGLRAHAKMRIKERYNVDFTDNDFRNLLSDIKSGRHFEYEIQGDDRVYYVMNVDKLGANVPVVYDKHEREIVTVMPHNRATFKRIAKLIDADMEVRRAEEKRLAQVAAELANQAMQKKQAADKRAEIALRPVKEAEWLARHPSQRSIPKHFHQWDEWSLITAKDRKNIRKTVRLGDYRHIGTAAGNPLEVTVFDRKCRFKRTFRIKEKIGDHLHGVELVGLENYEKERSEGLDYGRASLNDSDKDLARRWFKTRLAESLVGSFADCEGNEIVEIVVHHPVRSYQKHLRVIRLADGTMLSIEQLKFIDRRPAVRRQQERALA